MKTLVYAHNWSPAIADDVRVALAHVLRVGQEMPFFIWPEKSPKAADESITCARKLKELKGYCGLQSVMNTYFEQDLLPKGFDAQMDPRPGSSQKMDFLWRTEKAAVGIEIEFGYTSRLEADLLKFADAFLKGRLTAGIFVCATASLGNKLASGVATFENAVEALKFWHPELIRCPVAVVGLDHADTPVVDLSESQLPNAQALSGNNSKKVLWHVVEELRAGVLPQSITMPGAGDEARLAAATRRVAACADQHALF